MGEIRKKLGLLALLCALPVWANGDFCTQRIAAGRLPLLHQSQFLQDVARYLTGSPDHAEAVYMGYRRRNSPNDPNLIYPPQAPSIAIPNALTDLWKDLGLDRETFSPPTGVWQPAASKLWARRLISNSKVKGQGRLIYRRKGKAGDARISIAQTWDGTPGIFRETEIAVQRTGSLDWDFFVYDENGKLSASSIFHTRSKADIDAPAPITCLTCHYDPVARVFTFAPKSTGFSERLSLILP